MKTIIFSLILIVFYPLSTEAQILSGYGFKLGIAYSNQVWDYEYGYHMESDNQSGLTARFFVDILDIPFFKVEGETGYMRKGIKAKIPITTAEQPDGTGKFIVVDNKLDYLSIAVLAKLKINFPVVIPYLLAGPQFNVLLSKDISKGWEVIYDKFSKSAAGYSLGVGVEILNVLPISLLAEYRYEKDLSDSYSENGVYIKNYSHSILVGVRF